MGINEHQFDPKKHHLISNASCTTNCLAPVVKVLNDAFEIEAGLMTTVHSYTNDQNLLDNSHSDLRRARAAALSMIPTTTGAAKALGEVIPSLAGKLDGYAVRVPTPDVSMVDLALRFKKTPTKAEVNDVLKRAASTQDLRHILNFCEEELVSIDFMGSPYSSIVDAGLTNVVKDLVKVVAWYDNEIGFSNRVLELAAHVGKKTWL
jgi:glyceraldehyde-3-phosphate dehydrogenase type I